MIGIEIIAVPYDSGRRGVEMGAGPEAMLAAGLSETLRDWGHHVRVRTIETRSAGEQDPLPSAIELGRGIAAAVGEAREHGRMPLVLSGNCIAALGVVAGFGREDPSVLWLDAHGDLNTPETSPSGFVDGMAAAILLGWCHTDAARTIPGLAPIGPERLMLVGGHALDPPEAEAVRSHRIRVLPPDAARDEAALSDALDAFSAGGGPLYLHIDLDVLDPAEYAPANSYAAPGGLTLFETIRIVQEAAARFEIAAVTLSAYEPAVDPLGLIPRAALPLVSEALAGRPSA